MPSCMRRAYTLGNVAPAGARSSCACGRARRAASARSGGQHDTPQTRSRSTSRRAFERVEAWLRAHGFFAPGGEELEADLYLGYGLSSTIRRRRSPAPPEPCPLPLAACAVRRRGVCCRIMTIIWTKNGVLEFGPWHRTWNAADYAEAVERVREAIARGDVYQVNLVQHLSADFAGDPGALAAASPPAATQSRALSRATAGPSSPAHPSSSSRGAGVASGRARSRARVRQEPGRRELAARPRTPPST